MKKLETLGFKHFCMTVGNLPSSYVESLSYYECLLWLIKYLQEEVIPTVNNNSEVVEELQGLYLELKSYVDNYFDNLDVQEEINNKLDEMVEEGTLQEIIAEYLNSKAVFGYDTVADMKLATNLIDGSYATTLGYHTKGDGGKSIYKVREITNDDVVDEAEIIALYDDSLIAELIKDTEVRPEQYGAYGDDTHDDTAALQSCISKNKFVRLGAGKAYKVTDTITLPLTVSIIGCGNNSTIVKSYIEDDRPMFYCAQDTQHFHIEDFYLNGNNTTAIGFEFKNPYNDCVFRNLTFVNFKNKCIYLGRSDKISQTVVIDNCLTYMADVAGLDTPIFHLIKCYESNILNNKLLNTQFNNSPCLLLENVYDSNIQGNSFTFSHSCGIKITGNNCRQNRIISNTYEQLDGTYSIILDGTGDAYSIEYTLILEAFTYYSAPDVVYCNNASNGFIVGMACVGGRRNMVFNVNDPKVQGAYNNNTVTTDNGALTSNAFGIMNYEDTKRYNISVNDSANADYGLQINDLKKSKIVVLNTNRNWLGYDGTTKGFRIKMTSPDGSLTKYVGLNNSGELQVFDGPYYDS